MQAKQIRVTIQSIALTTLAITLLIGCDHKPNKDKDLGNGSTRTDQVESGVKADHNEAITKSEQELEHTQTPKEIADMPLSVTSRDEPSVDTMINRLIDNDANVRENSAVTLGRLGPNGQRGVRELVKVLQQSQSPQLRIAIVGTLGRFGRISKEASPFLVEYFNKADAQDSALRRAIMRAFGEIDPEPAMVLATLLSALNDSDNEVRKFAIRALRNLEKEAAPALPTLRKIAVDEDNAIGIAAARSVCAIDPNNRTPEVVSIFTKVTDNTDDVDIFDRYLRCLAIFGLGEIGSDSSTAIPALVKVVKDRDWVAAELAAEALGKIGRESVPSLVSLLRQNGKEVRSRAAYGLKIVGQAAEPAVSLLIEGLQEDGIRYDIDALIAVGPAAVPALVESLTNPKLRPHATEALVGIGSDAESAVAALVVMLGSDDGDLKEHVIRILAAMGSNGSAAVPALTQIVNAPNDIGEVRWTALNAIMQIDPSSFTPLTVLRERIKDNRTRDKEFFRYCFALFQLEDAQLTLLNTELVAALFELNLNVAKDADDILILQTLRKRIGVGAIPFFLNRLKSDDSVMSANAAESLGVLGPLAKVAQPGLLEAAQRVEKNVRIAAIYALIKTQSKLETVIPLLTTLFRDPDDGVRLNAVVALGKLGEPARDGATALCDVLSNDGNASVRRSAAKSLGQILVKSEAVIAALTAASKDADLGLRRNSRDALIALGIDRKLTIPSLITELKDKDVDRIDKTLTTLGDIGPDAQDALPEVMRLISHESPVIRGYAAIAVGKIDTNGITVPILIDLLKDRVAQESVARAAANALGRIGSPAISQLRTALRDTDVNVRHYSLEALGAIKVKAKVAIPDIIPLLHDTDSRVSESAATALGAIGDDDPTAVAALIDTINYDCRMQSFVRNSRYSVRIAAFELMGQNAIIALTQALSDKIRRQHAACALGAMGPKAIAAAPALADALIAALAEPSSELRRDILKALVEIKANPSTIVDALITVLDDVNGEVRANAVKLISENATDEHGATPHLIRLLKDKETAVRANAA
ncbi:MAG: HEAT repeat domain-containing protein, partial [Planctomycetaceae bacterium]|nr:HEAT repeat domain-containing protein [Planctomycetaceae bacterium]